MWPRRRRSAAPPTERKSASFFLTLGRAKAGLNGATYDRLAAEGYGENVIAFACINLIASAAASVDWQLYRKAGSKLVGVDSNPILDLIQNPNPAQSGREFIQALVAYHRLSGNAYVFGNGLDPAVRKPKPPVELQLFNPGKVKIVPGPSFLPARYEYRPDPQQPAQIYPVDQVSGRSAVMHLKTFNALNVWYGMSPLEAAALGVDIHSDGQKWNKQLIENGARPSGALVVTAKDGTPATLSNDQYTRLREMIDDQFTGPSSAGRPMLLEGGLDWKEMSINPKDMEFLEGKNSAARDIALGFGVPPMLLGIPGDNTFSNYEQAKLALWTDTVLPLLGNILDGFNRWLTPLYGPGLYLWYDEEQIPALEPLRKEKFERLKTADWMTLNEKRRATGQDDTAGGDTIFVPATNIPLELAGTLDPSLHPTLAEPAPDSNSDEGRAAKYRAWLEKQGYTPERAERLAKLVYG